MRGRTNTASIVWDDEFGIQYRICRLDYEEWEDGSFEYRFSPDYHILDMLPMDTVGGIPGLDLGLRRDVYVRRNMEPVFMTERSPSRNRVDVRELMEEVGLDHYDRLEWLIRTETTYAGDRLHVVRYEDPENRSFESVRKKDMAKNIHGMLEAIGAGSTVTVDGTKLSSAETTAVGRSLRMILASDRLDNPDRPEIPRAGRKKKEMSPKDIEWAHREIRSGTPARKVADAFGVSRATLYRRMREYGFKK